MDQDSVASPAIAIDALFLAIFDDHKGQSLIWQRSSDETDQLDGVEFQALPSGLHLVPTDTFYYHYVPAKTERPGRLGISVFQNKELSKEGIDLAGQETGGRGRLMLSLGVIVHNDGESLSQFPPLSGLRDLVSQISTKWAFDLKGEEGAGKRRAWLDEILEPFWTHHRSLDSKKIAAMGNKGVEGLFDGSIPLSADHPVHHFDHLIAQFGINLCTLWKYSSTNRRILFYTNTPLEPVCQTAWCTWIVGQRSSTDERDEPATASSSTFLGTVGLMDMAKIQGIKGGYVACTSDAIFKDRPQLWDLLVDLGSGTTTTSGTEMMPVSMQARYTPESADSSSKQSIPVTTKPITHTFSDESLWKEIQVVSAGLSEDPAPLRHAATNAGLWGYAYGAYSTLCDVCWGFCALAVGLGGSRAALGHGHGARAGTGYIRLPLDGDDAITKMDDDEEEENDSDDGELVDMPSAHDSLSSTRRILDIFQKRNLQLVRGMAKFGNKTSLSKDDMTKLGLSTWSWVDVDLVRTLHVQIKRDQALAQVQEQDDGHNPSIQVERGWFRWVSSIVGA